MIGRRIKVQLPDGLPIRPDHRTAFREGEEGVVLAHHPRWDAWLVRIRDTTVVLFPDEIKEIA